MTDLERRLEALERKVAEHEAWINEGEEVVNFLDEEGVFERIQLMLAPAGRAH